MEWLQKKKDSAKYEANRQEKAKATKENLRVEIAQVEDRRGPPALPLLFLLFLLPLRRRVRCHSPHGHGRNRRGRAPMTSTVTLKAQWVPRHRRSRSIRRFAQTPRPLSSVLLARLDGFFGRRLRRRKFRHGVH